MDRLALEKLVCSRIGGTMEVVGNKILRGPLSFSYERDGKIRLSFGINPRTHAITDHVFKYKEDFVFGFLLLQIDTGNPAVLNFSKYANLYDIGMLMFSNTDHKFRGQAGAGLDQDLLMGFYKALLSAFTPFHVEHTYLVRLSKYRDACADLLRVYKMSDQLKARAEAHELKAVKRLVHLSRVETDVFELKLTGSTPAITQAVTALREKLDREAQEKLDLMNSALDRAARLSSVSSVTTSQYA